jgi:hypothetical protein
MIQPDKLDRFVAKATGKALKTTAKVIAAPFVIVAAVLTAKVVTKTIARWVHEED